MSSDFYAGIAGEIAGEGPLCGTCPSRLGCAAASYCVQESRFFRPDGEITAPSCGTCQRSAATAWGCMEASAPCDAQSDLWGQWFLVQMYANDAKREDASAPAGESGDDDYDDEPCSHDCDEDCYNEYDEPDCRHEHCFNCGGCNCPGYCDDYQTYNLRPSETGGKETYP